MNRTEFIIENQKILATLKDFTNITADLQNILILGSVGLISHTQKVNYYRNIKDIDTIADSNNQLQIEAELTKSGYTKSTFIDDRMPFAKILKRFSSSRYTRFNKQGSSDLEILFTPFIYANNMLTIELFPFLHASLPQRSLMTNLLDNTEIKTISAEALYAVKQLTHNSFVKFYKTGFDKRMQDHRFLYECVNIDEYNKITNELRIKFGPIPIPIKMFLTVKDLNKL